MVGLRTPPLKLGRGKVKEGDSHEVFTQDGDVGYHSLVVGRVACRAAICGVLSKLLEW